MFLILLVVALALLFARGNSQAAGGAAAPLSPGNFKGAPSQSGGGLLDDLAEGWAQIEGFYKPGSLAQRYNNPVNIHGDWPGVVGHLPTGEAEFDDAGDGWDAADAWLKQQAAQHPDWSLQQLFAKVLGSLGGTPVNNDQGNSNAEAQYVANYLGVAPDTSFAGIVDGSEES